MIPHRSFHILSRAKSAAPKVRLQQQPTQQFSSTKAIRPQIQKVTPSDRAALRASRKQQAAQSLESQNGSAASSAAGGAAGTSVATSAAVSGGGKKPMNTKLVYGLGVGVPTALLGWAIADEDSPPAQLAKMLGITQQWDQFADQFARPAREKLLPDWPVSALLVLICDPQVLGKRL